MSISNKSYFIRSLKPKSVIPCLGTKRAEKNNTCWHIKLLLCTLIVLFRDSLPPFVFFSIKLYVPYHFVVLSFRRTHRTSGLLPEVWIKRIRGLDRCLLWSSFEEGGNLVSPRWSNSVGGGRSSSSILFTILSTRGRVMSNSEGKDGPSCFHPFILVLLPGSSLSPDRILRRNRDVRILREGLLGSHRSPVTNPLRWCGEWCMESVDHRIGPLWRRWRYPSWLSLVTLRVVVV